MCELDLHKCVVKKKEYEEDPLAKVKAKVIDDRTPDAHKEHQKRMSKVLERSNVDKDKVNKEALARIGRALRGE